MKDYIRDIKNCITIFSSLAVDRLNSNDVKEVIFHFDEKLKCFNPVLSFYGAYNSGKSSVINALFGKEICPVGDSPETYLVTEYKIGDWVLYDTPGIDAPAEHETITEEHIKKSECVIFVLSTDSDFECGPIYEKMADLTKRKKPFLMVLNDKNGVMRKNDFKEQEGLLSRINANIDRYWESASMDYLQKPDKIMVNAKTALKGKLENKKLLIQNSRILDLEKEIDNFVRGINEKDTVNALIDYLNPFVDNLRSIIISEVDDTELRKIYNSKQWLLNEKKKLIIDVKKILRDKVHEISIRLRGIESTENAYNEIVSSCIYEIEKEIDQKVNSVIERVSEEFKTKVKTILIDCSDRIKADYKTPGEGINLNKFCAETVGYVKSIPKGTIEKTVSDAAKSIFFKMRKMKIPKFKGRWGSTLEKWAGSAGKAAGYAVPWVIATIEIGTVSYQYHKEKQKIKEQTEAFDMMLSRLCSDIYTTFFNETSAQIKPCFIMFEDSLDDIVSSLSSKKAGSENDLKKLNLLKESVDRLLSS